MVPIGPIKILICTTPKSNVINVLKTGLSQEKPINKEAALCAF
jgi:hypothetical protein